MSWAREHTELGEQSPALRSHMAEMRDQAEKEELATDCVQGKRVGVISKAWAKERVLYKKQQESRGPILLGEEMPLSFYLWPVVWAMWVWCGTSNCVKDG